MTTTSDSPSAMMERRTAALLGNPDLEHLRGMKRLVDCHAGSSTTAPGILSTYRQRRRPCVLARCFTPPARVEQHGPALKALQRELVPSDAHLEPMVWYDEEDRFTALHFDNFENVMFVLSGTKVFTFYPPSQHKCLYHPWGHTGRGRISPIDAARPDHAAYPQFRHAAPSVAVVEAGDMLYIPANWSHDVHTLCRDGLAVGVNYWYPATLSELWRDRSSSNITTLWSMLVNRYAAAKASLLGRRMVVRKPSRAIYAVTRGDQQRADRYAAAIGTYRRKAGLPGERR